MDTALIIYATLLATLIVCSAIGKLVLKLLGKYEVTPLNIQKEELLTIPFILVGMLGMFGFIFKVSILSQLFWQIYFILIVVHTFIAFKLPKMKFLKEKTTRKQFFLINLVGFIISLPMIYMLGAYAFGTFHNSNIA